MSLGLGLGLLAPICSAAQPSADPSQLNLCSDAYAPDWTPKQGMEVTRASLSARPPKGVPVLDAVLKTCLLRVTEHDREPPKRYARADYARRQAFNSNNTRLVVASGDGSWHLYDANTLSHLEILKGIGGNAEPQWHPTDPDLIYHFPRDGLGMKLYELNLRANNSRVFADFGPRLRQRWPNAATAWTKGEGSPSADGRYWCLMVDDHQWNGVGIVTWDMAADKIIGMLDLHGRRPDNVTMSPSGEFCVVTGPDNTTAYKRDMSAARIVRKGGEHADIARGSDGSDIYVSIDFQGTGGPVFMVNLQTGVRTDLFPTYLARTATAHHFSGKAFARPGWVLVSTYAEHSKWGPTTLQWLHRKIFAVSLEKPHRVIQLAHHHSQYNEYFTEPHATVSRDFSRVLFNSNWGTRSDSDVDTFMVVLPPQVLIPQR